MGDLHARSTGTPRGSSRTDTLRRTKTQWDTGCTRGVPMLFGPAPGVTALKSDPATRSSNKINRSGNLVTFFFAHHCLTHGSAPIAIVPCQRSGTSACLVRQYRYCRGTINLLGFRVANSQPTRNLVTQEYPRALPDEQLAPLPKLVYVELADYCNLSCTFCQRSTYVDSVGKGGFIEFEMLKKLEQPLRAAKYFGLSGRIGEPLLHPKLESILRWLYEINPEILLRITTKDRKSVV